MTVTQHRFTGNLPAGDIFSIGWYSSSIIGLPGEHSNAVGWITDFMTGAAVEFAPGVVFQKITSSALAAGSPFHATAILATDVLIPGTSPNNSLPQDVSPVVTLRTAVPGPKGRGRIYLPAPNIAACTLAGELEAVVQTALLSALSSAWTNSRAGGSNPVIFSHLTGAITAITAFGMGTVFDHQSRRVNKVNTTRVFEVMP